MATAVVLATIGLCVATFLGCSTSDDHEYVKLVRAGKLKMLKNPTVHVIDELVRDPGQGEVTNVWLIEVDLADPQWARSQEIVALEGFRGMHFRATQNTDAYVKEIPQGDVLTTLEFYETDLTDDGVGSIAGLPQLEELRIEFAKEHISSAGLSQVQELSSLKKLHLTSDMRLSSSTFEALLPKCRVVTEFVPSELWER